MVSHKIIPVGAYEANCVILWVGEDALVLDPGQDAELLLAFLSGRNLRLRAILLTHGHFDHVNGIPRILEKNPSVPVYAHPSDWVMFGHPMNRNPPDYPGVGKPANLHDIRDIVKDFPSFGFEVLETPGHTPGSVCVKTGTLLLSGDTLFAGSVGRTDLPGGSFSVLEKSIRRELLTLPENVLVYPGHGPRTTVGNEKRSNPYLT